MRMSPLSKMSTIACRASSSLTLTQARSIMHSFSISGPAKGAVWSYFAATSRARGLTRGGGVHSTCPGAENGNPGSFERGCRVREKPDYRKGRHRNAPACRVLRVPEKESISRGPAEIFSIAVMEAKGGWIGKFRSTFSTDCGEGKVSRQSRKFRFQHIQGSEYRIRSGLPFPLRNIMLHRGHP